MKSTKVIKQPMLAALLTAMLVTSLPSQAKDTTNASAVPVKMTVTVSVDDGKRMPEVQKEDVFLKKGKERLEILDWTAARGDRAGLELFILIDDASDSNLGSHLRDLRAFIQAQPETTAIGVGYTRNGTVQIAQNLTAEHAKAAESLRLPLGTAGTFGSPYLSVADLMKRWPEGPNRRQVILLSDGIDRARRGYNALLNPDVDTANEIAQKTGTMIHTIYVPGTGHWHRNFWQANGGVNGLAKLSDVTGGESFYLGLQSPISLTPYLDTLKRTFDNQYILTFNAKPDKKASLQSINISTEVAGVDIDSANAVWVPGAK
jgi:hypothetical protein